MVNKKSNSIYIYIYIYSVHFVIFLDVRLRMDSMAIVEHNTNKKAAYLKLVENNRIVLIILFL